MDRLSESHKQALRNLVALQRENQIGEEFTVMWAMQSPIILAKEHIEAPYLSSLTLDLLAAEGLIFQRVQTETDASEFGGSVTHRTREDYRTCFITPAGIRAVDCDFSPTPDISVKRPPIEISESLARFHADFPNPTQPAFIMMQFGTSKAYDSIVGGIRSALDPHGMVALRADDKQYHDDLYFNILTYLHGCRFGIAVFERITEDDFNPNVSLEVGYMLGLGKSVCFLKDSTLRTLHTDLIGKLYRSFDPQAPKRSIPPELFAWLDQKGFIIRR